jgi:hypothetical protein
MGHAPRCSENAGHLEIGPKRMMRGPPCRVSPARTRFQRIADGLRKLAPVVGLSVGCFCSACVRSPSQLRIDRLDATPFDLQTPSGSISTTLCTNEREGLGLDTARDVVRAAAVDTVGFGKLDATRASAWREALGFYSRRIALRDVLFDDSLIVWNARLATIDADSLSDSSGIPTDICAALNRAAPAYRAVWWQGHSAGNKRMIASVRPVLQAYGGSIRRRDVAIVGAPWPSPLSRADVQTHTNRAGAYTATSPTQINISSVDYRDTTSGGRQHRGCVVIMNVCSGSSLTLGSLYCARQPC